MFSFKTILGAALLIASFTVVSANFGAINDIFDDICNDPITGLLCSCANAEQDLSYCKYPGYKSYFGSGSSSLGQLLTSVLAGSQLEGVTSIVNLLDKVAGTTVEAIKKESGKVLVNANECADAVGKIMCHLSLEALNCNTDKKNLCKQTCVDFIGKCVLDTAKDNLKELPKKICSDAGVSASICNLDIAGLLIVNIDISVCDELPSSNCDDLGLTEPLKSLQEAPRDSGAIFLVIGGAAIVLATLGGALWYRQRAASAAAATAAVSEKSAVSERASSGRRSGGSRTSGHSGGRNGSAVSVGRMSQNSGKTRTKA